ncbi:hypothetical protein SHLA_102c000080 [Shinella sp. DD12]|jgi:hypothetical protein|nr:hypothetical protein SHLA_102c000080 [Shinella sp. DD12]
MHMNILTMPYTHALCGMRFPLSRTPNMEVLP